jgi:hypothetical protein
MITTSGFTSAQKRDIAVVEALEAAMRAMSLLQQVGIIVCETRASLDLSYEIRSVAHALRLIEVAKHIM